MEKSETANSQITGIKKNKAKKRILIALLLLPILALIIILALIFLLKTEIKNDSWDQKVNNENLCSFVSGLNIVKDLPKNAEVSFRTYEFSTGNRNWITSCTIKKGKAVERISLNPDFELVLHEKYVSELGEDVCQTIQSSRKTDDLGIDTDKKIFGLIIKYLKTLTKGYGSCTGLV